MVTTLKMVIKSLRSTTRGFFIFMKLAIQTIAQYKQTGHRCYPEDTWSDSMEISNHNDLLCFMKQMHKQSARSFSDYPFGGYFTPDSLIFAERGVVSYEGNDYYGSKKESTQPEYFNQAKSDFEKWISAIKERLPRLRKAHESRLLEQKERLQLAQLQEKYY